MGLGSLLVTQPRIAVAAAALALISVATSLNLTVPETIKAGEATEVTVGFDSWKQPYRWEIIVNDAGWENVVPVCRNPVDDAGCANDALYEHYQLYLSTEEFMDTCYLTDLLPVGMTNPRITIPKDLGPPLSTYYITAIEFNGTKMSMSYEGVNISNRFALSDTDITDWTVWELYGGWVKPAAVLPCSSYSCYRECGLENSDGQGNMGKGKDLDFFACLNKCPDVYADPNSFLGPWSWYRTWESDEEGYIISTSISWKGWDTTTRYDTYGSIDATATTLFGTPTDQPGLPTSDASPTAEAGTGGGSSVGARMGLNVSIAVAGFVVAVTLSVM